MKKLLWLIVAVLLLSGCLPKKTTTQTTTSQKQEEKEFSGTLIQAMKLGVPMKCEWKQGEDSGLSYVKGEKLYVEFTAQGKSGYLLEKDNCMWTWDKDSQQGLKICSQPEESVPVEEKQPADAGVNWDVSYKCLPALVSDDKFNPPDNINFMDIDKMMQGIGQ